ncbi:MAG: hydrogenase/urease maturation nickel metallochaperone HypA [Candidatus Nanohaloarchaea archaeon]|nr:hydrogenase/urease maturation nickel metallochaperone HypA [Candidatus Nanohaloarchaea archaeon]
MQGGNETELVMRTIEELNRRQCNGHVKLELGSAIASVERFRKIFERFSEGTYFEEMDVEIDEVPSVVACSCGYRRKIGSRGYIPHGNCPRCGRLLDLERGGEFRILEPEPAVSRS